MAEGTGAEKVALRRRMRDRVRSIDAELRSRWSAAAAARFETLPEVREAEALLLFRSLPSEVETASLFEAALARGRRVWCPRVEGAALAFHRVTVETSWRRGSFGALEPDGSEALGPADLSGGRAVIAVPGVAFSPRRDRLGRGGGHYDRVLGTPPLRGRVLSVALAFELQVIDEVPVEPHDVPVDVLVTEARIVRS